MTALGETTAMLARMRALTAEARPREGGTRRLKATALAAPNPGKLRMVVYAPAGLPRGAALVVVLHGCGQGAEAHATQAGWIELADRLGFVVLAPEQTITNNLNRCFNWFSPKDIERGEGEAASIAAMVEQVSRVHRLNPDRVFVTGLSAGGAMTAVMLATYPELFAGGAIIAGIAYGVARGLSEGIRVMHRGDGRAPGALADLVRRAAPAPRRNGLRLSIWQGDADTVVSPANARDIAGQWTAALGLPQDGERVSARMGWTRAVWGDEAPGSPVVELNIVHGLGHGTPLSTTKSGGVGSPAPFMLEAGVSSTLEIADFWGLTQPAAATHAGQASARGAEAGRGLLAKAASAAAKLLRGAGLIK